ncbi:hypothetical protein [Burkholderia ubonensis]|uniref:Uncharacterized protein n=1 Tax=Burkholderia ubonensis TaxID=101571 RepID=A0A107FAI2_9BURK|nr:hypothetical protein [Burkholderia ubonensis]AOK61285.1 hypothetical protein WM29_18970 [Burkholderia ubonensis]KVS44185.1 hypothetical protein WK37_15210 [Burkholderia ubonensis]KVS46822.1 hypothetical protein WK38_02300 [Burkholderia ubonensis]KVS79917.1 hypothetical protein WK44_31885 [Burkholderia ubonensis]KVS82879.1 hypothetical protein WK42_09920 [Burkholderia ubonensis]
MTSRSIPPKGRRLYILDAKDTPVEVFDHDAWSRWMSENELVFRRTVLDESGVTITTRFRGVSDAKRGEALLFVTRVAGMADAQDNQAYAASTLDAALEQHERLLQDVFRKLTGR